MAYSRSPATLDAMILSGQLSELAAGRGCRWRTPPNESHRHAYKVREALFIAALYPDQYPELATAAQKFTIEVTSSREVQARLAKQTTEAATLATGIGQDGHVSPNTGLEKAGRAIATAGPQSQFTIIDAWVKAQPNSDPMYFPQANLDEGQLTQLYNWATNCTPPLMLMVNGEAVTVSLVDRAVVQYSWHPAGTPTPEWHPVEKEKEDPNEDS